MTSRKNSKTTGKAGRYAAEQPTGGIRKFFQRLCIYGLTLIGMLLIYFVMGGDSKKLIGVQNSDGVPASQSDGVSHSVGKPAMDENGNPIRKVSGDSDMFGSDFDDVLETGGESDYSSSGSGYGSDYGTSGSDSSYGYDYGSSGGDSPMTGNSGSGSGNSSGETSGSSSGYSGSYGSDSSNSYGSDYSGGSSSDYSGGSSSDYSGGSSSDYSGGSSSDYSGGSSSDYSGSSSSDYSGGSSSNYSGGSSSDYSGGSSSNYSGGSSSNYSGGSSSDYSGGSSSNYSGGSSSNYSGGSSSDYSGGSSSNYSGGSSSDYSGGSTSNYSGGSSSNYSGGSYSSGSGYSGGSSYDSSSGSSTGTGSSVTNGDSSEDTYEDFFPKTEPIKNYKEGVVTGPDGNPRRDEVKILEVGRGEPVKNHFGPAVTDFLDLFDFSITPDWIEANWSSVAIVGPLTTRGYRVPISTGPEPSDLVGSLTYYFNNRLELEKITFEGYTGDLDRLLISLKYFNMAKRITSDPNALLYISEELSDNRRSFLKSYFRLQSHNKAEPNKRYWLTMELYPPEK